ncbi:hypothetical protein P2G88_02920 [Aliiglaciecola sp. CAU 1673]|uniref:hypothetical protein n=1 Tax=Aliiglaciecola sp. CAU 1673 TaxID=3032595 RepID=UPI0023DA133E|nr:hypothetical protein [Aliiglaciecola sp. CAU 1673]MDF2177196.1 hypothetical protein [Aliiglaciecola sp. CAU 1673]
MSAMIVLDVSLHHDFFSSGYLDNPALRPTRHTKAALNNARLLYKQTQQGFCLILNQQDLPICRACCEDSPLLLTFMLFANENFFYATQPLLGWPKNLYVCGNQQPLPETELGQRLHQGVFLEKQDSQIAAQALQEAGEADLTIAPVLLIHLELTPNMLQSALDGNPPHYHLRFANLHSIWCYYLIGRTFEKVLEIRDLDDKVSFEQAADTVLPNGQMAKTFYSKAPLPLLQHSPFKFTLFSEGEGGEKILIKRLPIASAGQYERKVVNGVSSIMSEIYIHT